MNRNVLSMVIVALAVVCAGVDTCVADRVHGDTLSGYTYIDLTDDGVSNGEWAEHITTFEVFEPAQTPETRNSSFQTHFPNGFSYFDSVTGQTVVPPKNTAMLTMYRGSVTSWLEVADDDYKHYLNGRIWGTVEWDGIIPDFALLTEDTNEDGVYAYFGNKSGTLYTGLFGDSVFTSTDGNFFVGGSPASLADFIPAFDYHGGGVVFVSDFAYGIPEPGTMMLLGFGGLAVLTRRRKLSQ